MNREQAVREIIGKEAEKLGFLYQECNKSVYGTLYKFERNREGFAQQITITTTSMGRGERYAGMMFMGCALGNGNIDAENLIESKYSSGKYSSEKELREIFEHMARIIREKGEEVFDLKEYPKVEVWKGEAVVCKPIKNLNAAKWIKQIIGKEAGKAGFTYKGSYRDGYGRGYAFNRTHGEENYEDRIVFTIICNTIRMEFMRSGMGSGCIEATGLLESKYTSDIQGFISFDSEEEFKEILEYFARIIREKGEEAFGSMEVFKEENGYPGREMHWKLYQEHEELNQKYRKLYGLEDTEFTVKLMRQIVKLIVENQDKKFEEVKELLIGLAAVYGEQLIQKGNGRWEWQEGFLSHCWVKGIEGKCGTIPLNDIAFCWRVREENVDYLLERFP